MKGALEKGMEVWGKYLMARYKGDKTPLKIHRDDGSCDELSFDPFSDYEEWAEHEKEILKYVQGRVLDVGCGAGRHSLWLQSQGFQVVAIDVSSLAVEVARLRGVRDCRTMSVLEMPFEDNSFDTILFMGNNLGVAGNPDGTLELFITLSQIVRKVGRIIGTTYDPADTDDPSHLKYHELNRKRGRPIGQVTLRFEYKGEMGDWFDVWFISPHELEEVCQVSNWEIEKLVRGEKGAYGVVIKNKKGRLNDEGKSERKACY